MVTRKHDPRSKEERIEAVRRVWEHLEQHGEQNTELWLSDPVVVELRKISLSPGQAMLASPRSYVRGQDRARPEKNSYDCTFVAVRAR